MDLGHLCSDPVMLVASGATSDDGSVADDMHTMAREQDVNALVKLHGALMILAWVILAPLGEMVLPS